MSEYVSQLTNYFKSGYRSNAFAPYVWFGSLAIIIIGILMCLTDDIVIKRILTFSVLVIIFFGCYMYYRLFEKDPNLLRSEEYLLEDKKLNVIATKGGDISFAPVVLTTPKLKAEEDTDG